MLRHIFVVLFNAVVFFSLSTVWCDFAQCCDLLFEQFAVLLSCRCFIVLDIDCLIKLLCIFRVSLPLLLGLFV